MEKLIKYLFRIRFYKRTKKDLKVIEANSHLFDVDTVLSQYDELLNRKPII